MSSSAFPVIWAMKYAPAADAIERLILIALADAADADGCNSYRSLRSHLEILVDVSPSTFTRRLRDMEQRGLIRQDTTPPPARYLQIPHYHRPTRWEVCIPYSWWSDSQRAQIQREREDRGLPPITPQSRPDLAPPPPKKPRADKGKPNPKRGRKKADQPSGEPTPEQATRPASEGGGVLKTGGQSYPQGCLEDRGWGVLKTGEGCLEDHQPSLGYLPRVPSSSSYSSVTDVAPSARADAVTKEEEGTASPKDEEQAMRAAHKVLDAAVSTWRGHRAPTAAERRTLALRVADALAEGATPWAVQYVLTRDLERTRTRNAVAVVMHRTVQPEWWREAHVPLQPTTAPKPPWCGACSESTRLTENAEGKVVRCKDCHPDPHIREEDDAPAVNEPQANEAPGRVPAEAASVRSEPCAEHGRAPRNPETGECSRCAMAAGAAKFKTPTAKKQRALTA